MAGKWKADCFRNDHPITLELACGRGEYCLGLAQRYPERNFIGVDVKGARLWRGAVNAQNEALTNVAFIRTRIENILNFFESDEVDQIWITFPDPFLKESKTNRRLTGPNFLQRYAQLIPAAHPIHLKTDSPELYGFTQEVIQNLGLELIADVDDIYAGDLPHPDLDIKTYYERMHLADKKTIKYVSFNLKNLQKNDSTPEL